MTTALRDSGFAYDGPRTPYRLSRRAAEPATQRSGLARTVRARPNIHSCYELL